MFRQIAKVWNRRQPETHVVTDVDVQRAEDFLSHHSDRWGEIFTGLAKWIFATLITLSTGGVYLALTLGLHPDAVPRALLLFFVAIATSLVAAFIIIASITQKVRFFDELSAARRAGENRVVKGDFEEFFRFGSGYVAASFAVLVALAFIFGAGTQLADGIRICSQEDLEFSEVMEAPVARAGRASMRDCYFYEIDRLSSDPLIRARQEIELIRHAEETGFYEGQEN